MYMSLCDDCEKENSVGKTWMIIVGQLLCRKYVSVLTFVSKNISCPVNIMQYFVGSVGFYICKMYFELPISIAFFAFKVLIVWMLQHGSKVQLMISTSSGWRLWFHHILLLFTAFCVNDVRSSLHCLLHSFNPFLKETESGGISL